MDIRIENLTLHNFKGVRSLKVPMEGLNVEIAGRNGAGKSTIFDAFIWLLFGKDHRGQDWTNFDIKPIDPATGDAIHHLDHYVEAQLLIDGSRKILRREIREDWIKPRGQAEEVFKGHTQAFFIDGVPCSTKRDYDTAVAQWISEDIFKIVTNPHYLVDDQYTDWKARRKVLLSLAGDIDLTGIRARFADVLAEAAGTPLEDFRKKVAADRKATRKELDTANANIKAWYKALPEVVDAGNARAEKAALEAEAEKKVDAVKAEIADIDAAVLNANEAVGKVRAQINEKAAQIRELEKEQEDLAKRAYRAARDLYAEELEAWNKQQNSIAAAEQVIRKGKVDKEAISRGIEGLGEKEQAKLDALHNMGIKYAEELRAAFDQPDKCPTCGQPLPVDYLETQREEFEAKRRQRLEQMKADGQRLKDDIAEIRAEIRKNTDYLATISEGQIPAAELLLQKLQNAPISRPVEPEYDAIRTSTQSSPKYAEIAAKIKALDAECKQLALSNPADLEDSVAKRAEKDAEIARIRKDLAAAVEPLMEQIAAEKERRRLEGMIAAEEDRARELADELARLERLEFSAAELAKAEIDAQTDAVNALFEVARWKMFDYTLDGGAVEMCEALSPDGVPYRSMNDAMRVQIGMDVIRTVGARYGITAPIFIDNAESVLQNTFDTPAQVIRLVVADQDLTINK